MLRTFFALPMFLIVTLIFWELVLGAWLLSRWFYEREWLVLGLSAKAVWMALAALTIAGTLTFFVTWTMALVRAFRGRN